MGCVRSGRLRRNSVLPHTRLLTSSGATRTELEKDRLVIDGHAGDPEPYHCYQAHFHQPSIKARCLKLTRSHWHIEQCFQRSKDDLGLDHF